jgi:ATP-dependent Lhr-like helicase
LLPPPESQSSEIDITIDYVGNLDNAAVVLSRLYRGEKRLVYCDSRSRVEQLAAELRKRDIKTHVSHSSLSAEERQRSENAFNNEKDCIIVATSSLELGIDIGDLDRVIQIDAPATVSSFLQRLGRTGRRANLKRNCLFLATSDNALLQAAGLIDLWKTGYVEPIVPPPSPYHVFVQQILGLLLQEKGIGANTWRDWIGRIPIFKEISEEKFNSILQHMLQEEILAMDQGIIWFGPKGERLFGYKNFMEICSTFVSPPLFEVRYGNNVIGYVDEISFAGETDDQIILLAGRQWQVKHIHWDKKIADVKPSKLPGKSTWIGAGPLWSKELCFSIKKLLSYDAISESWSKRAAQKISDLREEFDWVQENNTGMFQEKDRAIWWTFAGKLTNTNIAHIIQNEFGIKTYSDNLAIHIKRALKDEEIERLRKIELYNQVYSLARNIYKNQKFSYKFNECLPENIIIDIYKNRFISIETLDQCLNQSPDANCSVSMSNLTIA